MFSTNLPPCRYGPVRDSAALPLKLQVGAINLFHGKGDLSAARQLDCNGVIFGLRIYAVEVLELYRRKALGRCERLLQDDLDLLAGKTKPILPFPELALDAR
jgi:hypothetical protein